MVLLFLLIFSSLTFENFSKVLQQKLSEMVSREGEMAKLETFLVMGRREIALMQEELARLRSGYQVYAELFLKTE